MFYHNSSDSESFYPFILLIIILWLCFFIFFLIDGFLEIKGCGKVFCSKNQYTIPIITKSLLFL